MRARFFESKTNLSDSLSSLSITNNDLDINSALISYYANVKTRMDLLVKSMGYADVYQNALSIVKSKHFEEAYFVMQAEFFYQHRNLAVVDTQQSKGESTSGAPESESIQIESRYEGLDTFYKTINNIRHNVNPLTAMKSLDQVFHLTMNDPKSDFLQKILFESFIAREMIFIGYTRQILSAPAKDQAQLKFMTTLLEKNSTEDLSKYLDDYQLYLKLYFAAHAQLLPQFYEANKDSVMNEDHYPDNTPSRFIF